MLYDMLAVSLQAKVWLCQCEHIQADLHTQILVHKVRDVSDTCATCSTTRQDQVGTAGS